MLKLHRAALPVAATALVLSVVAAPAFAAKHAKPEQMTCEEFLVIDEEVQPAIVYWLHGKLGEVDAIDIEEYQSPVAYVVSECHKDKVATVWEKVKHYFKTHTKPADADKMERDG